jgi:predicted amidohydrolase YtcJ
LNNRKTPLARHSIAAVASCFFLLALGGCGAKRTPAEPGEAASVVLKNGRIYTVDAARSWASSLAIRDGRIAAVGSDADTASLIGEQTQVIDLQGKLVLPGFHDVHVHPTLGVWRQCAIDAGKTPAEYQELLRKCSEKQPGTGWLVAWGWEPGIFTPKGMPHKALLDAVSTDRPIAVRSMGAHDLWVNSKALQLAGITRKTPDPTGGVIDRDPKTGEPMGGLHEAAMTPVDAILPPPSREALEDTLRETNRYFNRVGIIGWQDASVPMGANDEYHTMDTYIALRERGELKGHITLALLPKWDDVPVPRRVDEIVAASERLRGLGLEARTVKIFLDGALGGRTAALIEPYSDQPGSRGALHLSPELFNAAVTQLDAKGFQVHVHAIGDRAVQVALDGFAAALERNGKKDHRHLIAHAELIAPQDVQRFAQLNVVLQPEPRWAHFGPFGRMTVERVGLERASRAFPIGSLLRAGVKVAFSSDYPVVTADPLESIEVAVTRQDALEPQGEPWLPDEQITLEQAIAAYTIDAAYVEHKDGESGSLEAGKSADLVVLDRDIFKAPPGEISNAKVLATLFAGEAVHGDLASLSPAQSAK